MCLASWLLSSHDLITIGRPPGHKGKPTCQVLCLKHTEEDSKPSRVFSGLYRGLTESKDSVHLRSRLELFRVQNEVRAAARVLNFLDAQSYSAAQKGDSYKTRFCSSPGNAGEGDDSYQVHR